jgi:hypothetical protein
MAHTLDAYLWLAYRLRGLRGPTRISWPALRQQFGGGGYEQMKTFRQQFREALEMALAVYPEAARRGVRVVEDLAAGRAPSRRPPSGQGGLVQPERQVAAPPQPRLVLAPVPDPVAGRRDAVAAGGVVLERHARERNGPAPGGLPGPGPGASPHQRRSHGEKEEEHRDRWHGRSPQGATRARSAAARSASQM